MAQMQLNQYAKVARQADLVDEVEGVFRTALPAPTDEDQARSALGAIRCALWNASKDVMRSILDQGRYFVERGARRAGCSSTRTFAAVLAAERERPFGGVREQRKGH